MNSISSAPVPTPYARHGNVEKTAALLCCLLFSGLAFVLPTLVREARRDMHSLMEEKGAGAKPTAQEVEDRFDGNICRCTGYRPILQSFRKLASATDAAVTARGQCAHAKQRVAAKRQKERERRAMRDDVHTTMAARMDTGVRVNPALRKMFGS